VKVVVRFSCIAKTSPSSALGGVGRFQSLDRIFQEQIIYPRTIYCYWLHSQVKCNQNHKRFLLQAFLIKLTKHLCLLLMTETEGHSRGSLLCWGTMLQAGRSRVRFPMSSLDFSIYLILPAAL
jgi:hypothetical protein